MRGQVPNVDSGSTGFFQKNLSWTEVLRKAKDENKHIFVDCYTTWCDPCKKMDKDVFADSKVGEYFRDRFLSYKIQMDESLNDSESVNKVYADAKYIGKEYKVNSYPCFCFFPLTENWYTRLDHIKKVDDFIAIAKNKH